MGVNAPHAFRAIRESFTKRMRNFGVTSPPNTLSQALEIFRFKRHI